MRDDFAEERQREAYFRPAHRVSVTLDAVAEALPGAVLDASAEVRVSGVGLDSRAIMPGDLYAAVPGAHFHGAKFAAGAVKNGAVAIVTDAQGAELAADCGVPIIVVDDVRSALGSIARVVYGTADKTPQLFGVTGTNGKTTTTFMLASMLNALERKTGTIGTIGIAIGDDFLPATMTTPEAPQLHGLMARMHEANVTDVVMEVSSHSMVYQRISGLAFAVGGFTNLTQDHLDLHGTMQGYFDAKLSFFAPGLVEKAVITVDDEWGVAMAHAVTVPMVTLATTGQTDTDWFVTEITREINGSRFTLNHRDGRSAALSVGLPGAFNVSNAALAIVMLVEAGTELSEIADLIASDRASLAQGVPGRMELVNESPRAYVDFAHNPGGLQSVLEGVQAPGGRVIVVFGAAGERDALKRAAMGEIAATHADVVIVTDDDPHAEDAAAIRDQVLQGARELNSSADVREIFPRADAIAVAVAMAEANDVIVVAGRGHETMQEIAGEMVAIDDREEVRAAFAAKR